jgi:hypothetical protein
MKIYEKYSDFGPPFWNDPPYLDSMAKICPQVMLLIKITSNSMTSKLKALKGLQKQKFNQFIFLAAILDFIQHLDSDKNWPSIKCIWYTN